MKTDCIGDVVSGGRPPSFMSCECLLCPERGARPVFSSLRRTTLGSGVAAIFYVGSDIVGSYMPGVACGIECSRLGMFSGSILLLGVFSKFRSCNM